MNSRPCGAGLHYFWKLFFSRVLSVYILKPDRKQCISLSQFLHLQTLPCKVIRTLQTMPLHKRWLAECPSMHVILLYFAGRT